MTNRNLTNCFERPTALQDDWLHGRIPLCACSLELLNAQTVVKRSRMSSSTVKKLGDSIVEVWADLVSPKLKGTLADFDALGRSPTDRMRSPDVMNFARWIVRQSMDAEAPLHPTVAEYGDAVFVGIAMLVVAVSALTAPTPVGIDGELPLHTSWALLLLAAHRNRVTALTLREVVKHQRDLAIAEKKRAVAKRVGKYADVQATAVEIALAGKFPSIRKAAEDVFPKVKAKAIAAGWFKKGSERDSNFQTLYRHLRNSLGQKAQNGRK